MNKESKTFVAKIQSVLLVVALITPFLSSLLLFPKTAHADATVIVLTPGITWTVLNDWNDSDNTIPSAPAAAGKMRLVETVKMATLPRIPQVAMATAG
jgi:hypothetical protein